ncbi:MULTISPECIES: hypothetical protein [unclassified Streptomyces]|nr:hypothetical protein [Streptomyces sp. me109]
MPAVDVMLTATLAEKLCPLSRAHVDAPVPEMLMSSRTLFGSSYRTEA